MRKHNGKQLYGIQKILTTLKMDMNTALKGLSIKQKLAMKYVSKESKLTRIGDKLKSLTTYFFEIISLSILWSLGVAKF